MYTIRRSFDVLLFVVDAVRQDVCLVAHFVSPSFPCQCGQIFSTVSAHHPIKKVEYVALSIQPLVVTSIAGNFFENKSNSLDATRHINVILLPLASVSNKWSAQASTRKISMTSSLSSRLRHQNRFSAHHQSLIYFIHFAVMLSFVELDELGELHRTLISIEVSRNHSSAQEHGAKEMFAAMRA